MLNNRVVLMCAYTLAKAHRYAEAEEALLSEADVMKSPEAMDLLARIRMEQGDHVAARGLWQDLLVAYPNYEPARVALRKMRFAHQVLPSKGLLIGLLIFLSLCVVTLAGAICLLKRPIAPIERATIVWQDVPTTQMLNTLAPLEGRVARVSVRSELFAKQVVSRTILTQMLAKRLNLQPSQIYIAEDSQRAITVELEMKARD